MGTNAPDPTTHWKTGEPPAAPTGGQAPEQPGLTPEQIATLPPAIQAAIAAATEAPPAPAPAALAAPETTAPAPAAAAAPPAAAAPAPPPAAPEQPAADPNAALLAEIKALTARMAQIESNVTSGQLTVQETDAELVQKIADLRAEFENWPQRGGLLGPDGTPVPPPYDLKAHGLPQPGVTRDYMPGGQPDELSPVVIAHNKPILSAGNAGPAVEELAGLLAKVGYPNSISAGRNHAFAFDDTITSAVDSFKRDFHVTEDPTQFRPGEADRMVGPWIWEALLRAAHIADQGKAS